jgi:deazaflavin-dependent oxidoreductase (nitroreductase family)
LTNPEIGRDQPHLRYIRWVPSERMVKWIGRLHTWLYRLTGGLIGARVDGLDMLLLTAVGRRSGQRRCSPLPFFRDGSSLLLIASFGGNTKHPAWYLNLVAQPLVEVQVRRHRMRAKAHTAVGEERARLWQALVHDHPRYAQYQLTTEREIPVVVLEPETSG